MTLKSNGRKTMETIFENAADFAERYIRYNWDRNLRDDTSRQWCPKWWCHPEAYTRITFLWAWYEFAFTSDSYSEMAQWLQFFDYEMDALTQPGGCFRHCVGGHSDAVAYQAEEFPLTPAIDALAFQSEENKQQ